MPIVAVHVIIKQRVFLLLLSVAATQLLRDGFITLIIRVLNSHLFIQVCYSLLSFLVAVLTSDPLCRTVHDVVCLLNLALDQTLDGPRTKVLVLVLTTGRAARNGFHTEVDDCATDLNSLIKAWDKRGALSNQD